MVGLGGVEVVRGFLNCGCAILQSWKTGECCGGETCVSHDSHRRVLRGCVKESAYVKSVFESAWSKGLEKSDSPQGAKINQTL